MKGYGPESFGDYNAADYDALHDPGTTEEAVELLYELACGGRTLELAIGTGRIALPLSRRGLDVSGVEASQAMLDRLREKPGGDAIPVVVGDMADVPVEGPFDFVFLVFNTLFNLTSQEAQLNCFANCAARLAPGGRFLVEAFVPDFPGFADGRRVVARGVDIGSAFLEATVHDRAAQRIDTQQIRVSAEGVRMTPLPMRYAWPAEIDLMAKLAGLELERRWGGWDKRAYDCESRLHVSVYAKPS